MYLVSYCMLIYLKNLNEMFEVHLGNYIFSKHFKHFTCELRKNNQAQKLGTFQRGKWTKNNNFFLRRKGLLKLEIY